MQNKARIMSGMRPTGKLHLGHYYGVLTNWKKLQDEYDCFYCVADWHALTTKFYKTENLRYDVLDVVMDWLACGISPEQSTIYVQSKIPQIAELHVYLSMITPQNWVERDPTLKDMAKALRLKEGADANLSQTVSYGLMGYPVLMTSDILTFNADFVPVGIDQVAHIEITRDIARRFNNIYKTDYFKEAAPKLTEVPLLQGVDGQKMGKSFNNDIKISDDEDTTAKKIMKCITDRGRIRKDDLGNPENCEVAFNYYKIFANNDLLETIDKECRQGIRGCADCKRQLAELVNETFRPIREKRKEYENNIDIVEKIIQDGNEKARNGAEGILKEVREIIGMY